MHNNHIIGIGGLMHDGNLCLLKESGLPLFVGEEERFSREKRRGGVPVYALSYASKKYYMDLSDFSEIILSRNILPSERGLKNIVRDTPVSKFIHIPHHKAHAASAFYSSPFEESAILTLDGLGDDVCTMFGYGKGNRIKEFRSIHYHNSLGVLWMRTGWFLGFQKDHFFSGAKVMALAAYGNPVYADVFLNIFRLFGDGTYELNKSHYPIESISRFWEKEKPFFLRKALGIEPRRPGSRILKVHKDIAASLQYASEELVLHMAKGLHKHTGSKNLCLAGGVALNCVQNSKLLRDSPFKNIFIVPCASDCGDGLGAILYHFHHNLDNKCLWQMRNTYLGAGYSTKEIEQSLQINRIKYTTPSDIAKKAARLIANGKVIGWFQGRSEVGPRALGNRSILADPRRSDIQEYLNKRIKHREWFRPFAPSVLKENVKEYFKFNDTSPFMLFSFPAIPERQTEIPGVIHADGTARIQTVTKKNNPLFRRLIEHFYNETGVPMVLNTSFNDCGEPIVNSPADAIRRFLNSELDAVFIGPFFVKRR